GLLRLDFRLLPEGSFHLPSSLPHGLLENLELVGAQLKGDAHGEAREAIAVRSRELPLLLEGVFHLGLERSIGLSPSKLEPRSLGLLGSDSSDFPERRVGERAITESRSGLREAP